MYVAEEYDRASDLHFLHAVYADHDAAKLAAGQEGVVTTGPVD